MNKIHIALITAILLAGGVAAQSNVQSSGDINTVILASTANYPDAMIASGPAEMLGVPVLLTDQDEVPESTQQALDNLEPENVVLVGGPAVISEEVEAGIEADYSTTRLWGTTQIGTSIDVSDYFWTESEEAVIIQYPQDEDRHQLLTKVKDEADERPILISDEGSLSASVITRVEELGVTEAEVYSTNAVNVTQDLEEVGVEDVELYEEGENRLEDQLQEETDVENRSELVIIAASNFQHTISAPSNPNSASYIVSSEEQIEDALELVEESNPNTTIQVVGKPDLAQSIADRIESETDRQVERASGENAAEQVAAKVTNDRERWANLQNRNLEDWEERMQNNPGIQNAANKTLEKARSSVNENSSEEAREALEEAEEAFSEGDYFEAKKMAARAHSEAKVAAYGRMDREQIREQVKDERQSMQEFANEMVETSQEMAEELREAESPEERREIVKEYRSERQDLIDEMREERREFREEEVVDRRERSRNRTTGERNRFEQESGEAEDLGNTETKLEVEGNEVKAEVTYTGSTGGYEVQETFRAEGDQLTFEVNFQSPEGAATQVITEYSSELERQVEDGNYTAEIIVSVDGETQETLTRDITVPSNQEFELESEEQEDSEQAEDEDEETEEEEENETEEESGEDDSEESQPGNQSGSN